MFDQVGQMLQFARAADEIDVAGSIIRILSWKRVGPEERGRNRDGGEGGHGAGARGASRRQGRGDGRGISWWAAVRAHRRLAALPLLPVSGRRRLHAHPHLSLKGHRF